jgi:hypothetical protein
LERHLEGALGDHTEFDAPLTPQVPPDIARSLTATCIHTPMYGTRSSTIVAVDPGRVLRYRHAEGAPCKASFHDVRGGVART